MLYYPAERIMARGTKTIDQMTLQMALAGYEIERNKIEDKIRQIKSQLKGKSAPAASVTSEQAPAKRKMSAAARKRIAVAQKKRWAAFHKRAAEGKD
jgi:hypothetical protein